MPQAQPPGQPSNLREKPLFLLAQAEGEGGHSGETSAGETRATTEAGGGHEKHSAGEVPDAWLLLWNSLLVVVALLLFAWAARRKLAAVPKGFQNFAEWVVESLNGFTVGIIGPEGKRFTPLVGTVFLYILLMNLLGLIPGLHSPTANLSITLALGVVVFVYVQYLGIRTNGFGKYIMHFVGPMPAAAPLMLPVELISECVKPFTLAVRLFGNIFGEDVILIVLAGLGAGSLATMWIPLHFPVLLLALLTAFVQAMVFSILTCIYISLMTQHDHEEHGEAGSHEAAHAHTAGH